MRASKKRNSTDKQIISSEKQPKKQLSIGNATTKNDGASVNVVPFKSSISNKDLEDLLKEDGGGYIEAKGALIEDPEA